MVSKVAFLVLFLLIHSALSSLSKQEEEALLSLLYSFPQLNWEESRDFCSQPGILCASHNRRLFPKGKKGEKGEKGAREEEDFVEGLNLSTLSLNGNFPTQLFALESLKSLDLSVNSFSGNIPSEILLWEDLIYLDLSQNQFSGEIPKDIFKKLKDLQHVDMSFNQLTSIPEEYGSRYSSIGMNYLDLSHNEIMGTIPKKIANFDDLLVLRLNDNHFYGTIPKDFGDLDELVVLDLSNNHLAGKLPDLQFDHFQLLLLLGTNSLCPLQDYSQATTNDSPSKNSIDSCQICNQNSCLNGGSCSPKGDGFKCNCQESSFEGEFCEEEKDGGEGGGGGGEGEGQQNGGLKLEGNGLVLYAPLLFFGVGWFLF